MSLSKQEEIKIGDNVHVGMRQKGGAGISGTVTKIDGDRVHIKGHHDGKTYRGALEFTMKESEDFEDFDEMDETVFDKQKFVVHYTSSSDGKRHRRSEESFGPASIVRKLEMVGHKVHDITHNGESVMHVARKVLDARMNESEEMRDIEELDETVFDKQKFVVHYTSSSDGKRHRRSEESWGPAGIVRKMEMVGHKVHDITHNGESVMHVARKVLDARMNEETGQNHIAYHEGYSAKNKGKNRQHNPYKEGSTAASMWAKGWEHAFDGKEPMKFVNESVIDYGDKVKVTGPVSTKGKRGVVHDIAPSGKYYTVKHKNGDKVSYHVSDLTKIDESMEEAYGEEDHIQQTLADRDINSKIDRNTVVVHKSNVAKTKQILKKMGHDHEVRGGLNESDLEEGHQYHFHVNPNFNRDTAYGREKIQKATEILKKAGVHGKTFKAGEEGDAAARKVYKAGGNTPEVWDLIHNSRTWVHESVDFGIPSFSEFLSEMTGEPTIEECYAMAVEDFLMSEEFEQLDEISKKTLGSYIRQASRSASELSSDSTERFYQSKGDESRGLKRNAELKRDDSDALLDKSLRRQRGVDRAVARLTKEEYEQLDELSKGTLKDYIRKASSQQFDLGKNLDKGDVEHFIRTIKKTGRRHSGILRATGQLARESEQIDELSPYTLASYITQASLDLDKQSRNQGRKIAKGEPGEEEQERGNKRIKGIVKAGYKLARKANRNQN